MEILKQENFIATSSLRLDTFLSDNLPQITRSKIKNYIDSSLVKVNSNVITKAGYKLSCGDNVEIQIPKLIQLSAKPQNIDLDIVYEDDDLMVINKPQGMVVHPSCGNAENTLVNALMYHTQNLSKIKAR